MAENKARGSSKLDPLSKEALLRSITAARDSFIIERWWKYGQPKIDLIRGVINVHDVGAVGGIVTDIIKQHGDKVQIGLELFPYGILNPDGVHIKVQFENKV